MSRRTVSGIRLMLASTLLLALAGSVSHGAAGKSGGKPASVPGEIIVGFEPGVSHGQQISALARAGAVPKPVQRTIP